MATTNSLTATWNYGTLIDKSLSSGTARASVTLSSDSKFQTAIAPIKAYKGKIKSATLSMEISGSLATCGYTVNLNGTTLVSKSSGLSVVGTTISKDITSFVESETENAGNIAGDLYVSIGSGLSTKHCENVKIVINWEYTTYKISLVSAGNGTVEGGGNLLLGGSAEMAAIPDTGYHFVKWSDGNTNPIRTVTVTGDATYTAYFELDKISKIHGSTETKSGYAKEIYVGTTEHSAVYLGTEKIYG